MASVGNPVVTGDHQPTEPTRTCLDQIGACCFNCCTFCGMTDWTRSFLYCDYDLAVNLAKIGIGVAHAYSVSCPVTKSLSLDSWLIVDGVMGMFWQLL